MTRDEFTGQFTRLCRGLDYAAMPDQTEAIYRRLSHVRASVWAESVTTLLCDGRKGYLPKLEHVLAVIDAEAERQRKAAIERDKPRAESVFERLSREASEENEAHVPLPGTPLFFCIRAYASRADCLARLGRIEHHKLWSDARKAQERERLAGFLARAEQDIAHYSPLLSDEDAAQVVERYEREGTYAV